MSPERDAARRVVVTGLGCVTPLGRGVDSSFDAACAGQSGIALIESFDTEGYASRIGGEVTAPLDLPDLSKKEARRLDRGVLLALVAADEALASSGVLEGDVDRDRIGVAIGSGIGGLNTLLDNHAILLERGPRRVSPFTIPMSIANMPAGYASIHFGLRGANFSHVSACASGAHAIGESARALVRGEVDAVLAGGTEAPITTLGVAGFGAMRALSTRNDEPERASRPFDRARDGFVIGEGAGTLVLETLERARGRGARVLAEIAGYAATADAAHIAAPDESGEGVLRCMRLALADAGVDAAAIDHVNAHATSTPAGDPIEARALATLLGDRAGRVPVSATKSMTGHMLGAAGAVEAVLSIRALASGRLPPTINLEDPDADCDLDHVLGKARDAQVSHVLSNSFGFGGTNASLMIAAAD